jgi:NADH:ubiquinone oxidoreductase subunit 5 (subunit L)/multisubunit Na+/H+ antiporter MnhA subunit
MFLVFAIATIVTFSSGRTGIGELPVTFVGEAALTSAYAGLTVLDVAMIALTLAAFVKSAQVFFHI